MKKILSSVAALMFSASLAFAGGGHKGSGMGHCGHGGQEGHKFSSKLSEKLNLSEAQKQQISDIERELGEQNQALNDSYHQTKKEFHEAKKANDTARMNSLRPVLDSKKADMKERKKAQWDRILNILTPEQRSELEAMKDKHGKDGQHRNHKNRT